MIEKKNLIVNRFIQRIVYKKGRSGCLTTNANELINSKDNEGISEDEVVAIAFCWEEVVCWFTTLICIFEWNSSFNSYCSLMQRYFPVYCS